MTEYPFIYICSHAGKIGNFRWVNSDTRTPDMSRRWRDPEARGYWGRCGLVDPPTDQTDQLNKPQ